MEIIVKKHGEVDELPTGWIALQVELDLDDVSQLKEQALRALEIERALPAEMRTELADADESAYISEFIRMRAARDALESYGIVPAAEPNVTSTAGAVDAKPFTCFVSVCPRPHIGLDSLDPVDLATNRIASPGFSQKAAEEGSHDIEYLADEKALRMALVRRLDGELPESVMRALGDEYQQKFERALAANGGDPETYRATHQIDEEQYSLMLTRRALADAYWNYALDAVFAGKGLSITQDDVLQVLDSDERGYAEQAFELHELRGDLDQALEKARRAKALDWLRANAIR